MDEDKLKNILQYFGIIDFSENNHFISCVFGSFVLSFDQLKKVIQVRTQLQDFISFINKIYDVALKNYLIEGSFTNLNNNEIVYYVEDEVGFIKLLYEMQLHNQKSIQDKLYTLRKTIDDFDAVLDPYGKLCYGAKPTDLKVSNIVYGSKIDIQMMNSSRQNIRYFYHVDGTFSNEVFYYEGDIRIEVKHYLGDDGDKYLELNSCDEKNNLTRLVYNLSAGFGIDSESHTHIPLHSLSIETISFIIDIVSSATDVATCIIQGKMSKNTYVKK